MNITTKGRYALRIMVDLAQQKSEVFVPLKTISTRQEISKKYSEMIIGLLNKAGFVLSSRGKGGGYKLSKASENYTVGSVQKQLKVVWLLFPVSNYPKHLSKFA